MRGASRSGAAALLFGGLRCGDRRLQRRLERREAAGRQRWRAPAMSPVAQHGQLKVVGTQLRDQAGNPVQLKGVSSQWLNYESKPFSREQAGHRSTRATTGSCR